MSDMSKFDDLDPFVRAMEVEYLRHYPDKGDSWKNEVSEKDLIELYDRVYRKWKDSGDIHELVDSSLVGAMIWVRINKTLETKGLVIKWVDRQDLEDTA